MNDPLCLEASRHLAGTRTTRPCETTRARLNLGELLLARPWQHANSGPQKLSAKSSRQYAHEKSNARRTSEIGESTRDAIPQGLTNSLLEAGASVP